MHVVVTPAHNCKEQMTFQLQSFTTIMTSYTLLLTTIESHFRQSAMGACEVNNVDSRACAGARTNIHFAPSCGGEEAGLSVRSQITH